MDSYKLNLDTNNIGGYLSSEQIDLLSIIRCKFPDELIDFVLKCEQIKKLYDKDTILNICMLGEENAKRKIFKDYQDSLTFHDSNSIVVSTNKLKHIGIKDEDIQEINKLIQQKNIEGVSKLIIKKYPNDADKIFRANHRFVSRERDQIKASDMFNEFLLLNSQLDNFNTILIGSGRIYDTVNNIYPINEKDKRYDFYKAKRDLDFAYNNGKQVRYHSLLVRDADSYFVGKKEEIIDIISDYVRESIDFVNNYNNTHTKSKDGKEISPVINSIDLFNEIVTFDEMIYDKQDKKWKKCIYNEQQQKYLVIEDETEKQYRELRVGEVPDYRNSWEIKYGITLNDLLPAFQYALDNKQNGINYLYNEPFMENDKRRKKVFEVLYEIDNIKPGLIDTLGTQTHITITESSDKIDRCFKDLKDLQDKTGKKIQITEFDMSLGSNDIFRVFGKNVDVTLDEVYQYKGQKIREVEQKINESGVKLSGISYWSLTDGIDSNLERLRTNALSNGKINNINEIPTACGGLYPTHIKYTNQKNINQTQTLTSRKKLVRKLNVDGKISLYFILSIIIFILLVSIILNIWC